MPNTSSAYDLSAFASQPAQRRAKSPQLQVVKNQKRAASSAFSPRALCAFAIVVTLASLIVYNQVCLNEVTGEINQLNRQLAVLESESVRYASLLESTVSLRAVAQQAEEELGMIKLDQFRTVYVYLYEEDQIVLSRQPAQEAEQTGVLAALSSILHSAKEYIAGL